jgi:predicted MPP superfamily phosphohydrolase
MLIPDGHQISSLISNRGRREDQGFRRSSHRFAYRFLLATKSLELRLEGHLSSPMSMLSKIALSLFAVVASLMVIAYGFLWEPFDVEVTFHRVSEPNPDQKIRIAQLSDMHIQNFGRREKSVIQKLGELKADILIISGDAIDRADALPALKQFLDATKGVQMVAVLGNWEHWSDVDLPKLKGTYEGYAGGRLLINQSMQFEVRQRSLNIFGLDDFTAGTPDSSIYAKDFGGNTSIIVQHSPAFFGKPTNALNSNKTRVCLAGHTHAGQITLFGWPLWRPTGSGDFTAGWYSTETCQLYVSRGIGTSVLPIRFGSRPEIAIFDI